MNSIDEWAKSLKDSKKPVIIEGIKDRRALADLGITNTITLSRMPIYAIIEEVASKYSEVVILTDFDKKGKELYGKLSSGLQRLGVRIDRRFREFLQKTQLSHIEGISTYNSNNYKGK